MSTYNSGNQKKPFGECVLEMLVRVLTMALFLLLVTPLLIAPAIGVTREEYYANEIYWTVVSLILGYVIAWPVSKLVARSIRGGMPR